MAVDVDKARRDGLTPDVQAVLGLSLREITDGRHPVAEEPDVRRDGRVAAAVVDRATLQDDRENGVLLLRCYRPREEKRRSEKPKG